MDSSRGGSRQVTVVMLTWVVVVVVVLLLLLLPALSLSPLSRSLSLRSGRFHSNHVQHKTSLDCK